MLMLSAVSVLLVSGVQLQTYSLGDVVVSGRPCLRFENSGMIHQHPLLLVYIGFSTALGLCRNSMVLRFMVRFDLCRI